MCELYREEDLSLLRSRIRNRLLVLGIPVLALLAVLVYSCVRRIEWLTVLSVALLCFLLIFCIDLFILPLRAYERMIRAALTGRRHEENFVFSHAEPEISEVDGVPCRSLIFLGKPDKHGTRDQLFYWDRELPLPAFSEGETVSLRYTGKNIIAYQRRPQEA